MGTGGSQGTGGIGMEDAAPAHHPLVGACSTHAPPRERRAVKGLSLLGMGSPLGDFPLGEGV